MSRKRYTFEHWQIVAVYLMIYDILAVNLSYLFVLWMRFDCAFSQIPSVYFHAFLKIASWHTAFSLLVFWWLRLYKSIWRYAGPQAKAAGNAFSNGFNGNFYTLIPTIFAQRKMPGAFCLPVWAAGTVLPDCGNPFFLSVCGAGADPKNKIRKQLR